MDETENFAPGETKIFAIKTLNRGGENPKFCSSFLIFKTEIFGPGALHPEPERASVLALESSSEQRAPPSIQSGESRREKGVS